eukprot:2394778-Pyramimonas_sp.AAC.1
MKGREFTANLGSRSSLTWYSNAVWEYGTPSAMAMSRNRSTIRSGLGYSSSTTQCTFVRKGVSFARYNALHTRTSGTSGTSGTWSLFSWAWA